MTTLEQSTHISVRTSRRTGEPVDTPVWHVVIDGTVYFSSPAHTGKLARLRRHPHVQIAPCNARGTPRGPWYEGTARLLTHAEFAAARAAICARHPIGSRVLEVVLRLRNWDHLGVAVTLAP